jgi:GT2 family glycosyltransferase
VAESLRSIPIFLVHWNAPDWLPRSIDTILSSDTPVDVFVIDNGPPAATRSLMLPEQVKLIPALENKGYAGGANMGLRIWLNGDSPYCIVGAHDLHVEPATVRLLVEAADTHPDFGIIGPDVERGGRGALLGMSGVLEERVWISGTCMLLRRECIESIGLFDELLHSYAEDEEICLRASLHDFKVGILPRVKAHGLGSRSPQAQQMWMANRIVLAARYRGLGSVPPLLARYVARFAKSALAAMILRGERRAAHQITAKRYWGATVLGLSRLRGGYWKAYRADEDFGARW